MPCVGPGAKTFYPKCLPQGRARTRCADASQGEGLELFELSAELPAGRPRWKILPIGKKIRQIGAVSQRSYRSVRYSLRTNLNTYNLPIGKIEPEPTQVLTIKSAEDFGKAVKQARRRERLTQRQLALSVGTGERFIVNLENGKNTAHIGKALEVASSLGLKITATYED